MPLGQPGLPDLARPSTLDGPIHASAADADAIESAVAAIESEFAGYLPHEDRVTAACGVLQQRLAQLVGQADNAWVGRLLPLPARRTGAITGILAAWLLAASRQHPAPWPLLEAVMAARDPAVQQAAVAELAAAIDDGRLAAGRAIVEALAERVDEDGSELTAPDTLAGVARIVERCSARGSTLEDLLAGPGSAAVRRLAARLLDRTGELPSPALVARVLGAAACPLAPYLAFTRASHRDVLDAEPLANNPEALCSFLEAESACGERVLADVVAALGWARLNCGIEARRCTGIAVSRSLPLVVEAREAALFDGCTDVRRVFDRILVLAVGRSAADAPSRPAGGDAVSRFRAANVIHAELLAEILDVAPLTRARLERVLDRIGRLVADFGAIFGQSASPSVRDEVVVVTRVHAELVTRVQSALGRTTDDPLPMDVCRLVQPFEDPAGPGDVHTLHGLKRYLHQRSLSLAFALIGTGPRTTRTVDLAVATPGRPVEVGRHLEFIDLEGEDRPGRAPVLPYAVRSAADAFGAQLLHGIRITSHLRVFCYGHEVHCFARFRNHPAFVRIDYSPPLRGGMIDLQYAGVSISELSVHPHPALDAIRTLFERLDFVVSVDATRIHARYDKEHAVTLDDLLQRAERLFHLLPYLMDIDWVVGSLQASDNARRLVTEAWADRFARWGVLPFHAILTKDRSGILRDVQMAPDGPREISWPGCEPYADRLTDVPSPVLAGELARRLDVLGVETRRPLVASDLSGQFAFREQVLGPIRRALERGEVVVTQSGLARRAAVVFERTHEVDHLATLLESGPARTVEGVRLAGVVALLDRHVRFSTTGSLNGYDVQRANVSTGADQLTVFALRDGDGIARLACATADDYLWRSRADESAEWTQSACCDVDWVVDRLRRANILGPVPMMETDAPTALHDDLRRLFGVPRPAPPTQDRAGGQTIRGMTASPGRAAGLARLLAGRWRRDALAGAILVAPRLDPGDAPCLFESAGIAATGGGILSHLGLLAVESGKPALIVEATWEQLPGGEPVVRFTTLEYEKQEHEWHGYRLQTWHRVRETSGSIRDGDLVVIDGGAGTLMTLGHDQIALALHDSLGQSAAASLGVSRATDPNDLLALRGHHLRAKHQLEKVIGRVRTPALAAFAVDEVLGHLADTERDIAPVDCTAALTWLVSNPIVGNAAADAIRWAVSSLSARVREARAAALTAIPASRTCHDVLALRLQAVRVGDAFGRVVSALDTYAPDATAIDRADRAELDRCAVGRLRVLGDELAGSLSDPDRDGGQDSRRLELERLCGLVGEETWRRAVCAVAAVRPRVGPAWRWVVAGAEGGLNLAGLVGSKAANLGELARILGAAAVPPWFAVVDQAFARAFTPAMRARIAEVLSNRALDAPAQAAAIREAWLSLALPADVRDEIVDAYRRLGEDELVAVRSSAFDEDVESSTRAGQFDTFLFVKGEASLVEHVRLAWSGLWSERAVASGRTAAVHRGPGGLAPVSRCGLVVQRMVRSRVSGVMQTVNAAEDRPHELIISVGLGLGEGIVSGAVAADHVVVSKGVRDGQALRFRYMTADKRERIVFDQRRGQGTVRATTLAHQRLRPALEYPELQALVDAGLRLERAYGRPLDTEFAFEGERLYILQARPVPASFAVWRETANRYPLASGPVPDGGLS